jgi:hypothetical protein
MSCGPSAKRPAGVPSRAPCVGRYCQGQSSRLNFGGVSYHSGKLRFVRLCSACISKTPSALDVGRGEFTTVFLSGARVGGSLTLAHVPPSNRVFVHAE